MYFDVTKTFLWVWRPARILGHLHDVVNAGFTGLALKLNDDDQLHDAVATRQVAQDAASIGLPVCYWGYIKPGHLTLTVRCIAANLPSNCTDYIVDAESEWETAPGAGQQAEAFMHALAEATQHRVRLHLSTFDATQQHPSFPYQAFLRHAQAFMPQAYDPAHGSPGIPKIVERVQTQCQLWQPHTLGKLLLPTVNKPELVTALRAQGYSINAYLFDGDDPASPDYNDPGVEHYLPQWSAALKAGKASI